MSEVAVCTTVRFAASGWIFCPRFARAPSDVGVSTASVASTNLEQNAGDPWVAPTISIPQTGAHARRTAGMRAPRPKGEGQDGPREISGLAQGGSN